MNEPDMLESPQAVEEFRSLMQEPAARQAFVELKRTKEKEGASMKYSHVKAAVFGTPWAIREEYLRVITDIVLIRIQGGQLSEDERSTRIEAARRQREVVQGGGGVAVIPVSGVLIPKANMFVEMSGGTSVESFRSAFRATMASADVRSIVLDFDSPGGMVDQIPEMAAELRAARGTKPIVAVANTLAASGAYWLAAQADELVVSKSARVGSIGVIAAHEDQSAHDQQEGFKTTLVSAGKFKTEANPFEPLGDEAKAHIQSMVDGYYSMFVSDVARGRGAPIEDVRSGFGQGRVVAATEAVRLGMADRIATLEAVVSELLSGGGPASAAAADSAEPDLGSMDELAALDGPGLDPGEPETGPEASSPGSSGEAELDQIKAQLAVLSE